MLRKIGECRYEIPQDYKTGMRVPGLIFTSEDMLGGVSEAAEQVANVATLPGILKRSMAMPDIHWGYGFPIGGVAAMDADEGVISPGGVGFDINCGVRLLTSDITHDSVKDRLRDLVDTMFREVPSGVGAKGKVRMSTEELRDLLVRGASWATERGYGYAEDIARLEEEGCMRDADAGCVSQRAVQRGAPEVGTLGAGNHFLELQRVDRIYDESIAKTFGLFEGQITVMIHTGSRGCGHQICTDYLQTMEKAAKKYGISLCDPQLACAPVKSEEGQRYYRAMCCGANYAWANRQMITHWIRDSFGKVLGKENADLRVLYDVAHNIAKMEEHEVDGKRTACCVHRKGATRAFYDRDEISKAYRAVGQPVLIPGDMGTASYVLVGTEQAMRETFGSTCHGAGRLMSRNQALRDLTYERVSGELNSKGIYLKAASKKVAVEEAPQAYKRVDDVVEVCERAGISKRVARMVPLGVVKG
jgi:tRNA-splicing ligase RtcB